MNPVWRPHYKYKYKVKVKLGSIGSHFFFTEPKVAMILILKGVSVTTYFESEIIILKTVFPTYI